MLAPVSVIEFNENPTHTLSQASEQLEHLYIHAGLQAEKINELVAALNIETVARRDLEEHFQRFLAEEWPYRSEL